MLLKLTLIIHLKSDSTELAKEFGMLAIVAGPQIRGNKMIFFSQPKHMFWVLKRTFSIRRFFKEPKTHV